MKEQQVKLSEKEYETAEKLIPLLQDYGKLEGDSDVEDLLRLSLRFLASTVQEKIHRERRVRQGGGGQNV